MDAARISVGVKATGVSCVIPDDDIARLMYYLNCVNVCLRLDELNGDLLNYRDYWRLSPQRKQFVVQVALLLSPDELMDKVFFRDEEGDITKDSDNEFCDITVGCDLLHIDSSALIAGSVKNITKVMFFKSSWIRNNYILPMARICSPVRVANRPIAYRPAPRRQPSCLIS